MSDRLPTTILVGSLLRRVNDAGGLAVVLAKGDAQAGAILAILVERGGVDRVVERGFSPDGTPRLVDLAPAGDIQDYWRRRRRGDPDLWVVELDIPFAERFAAETIL